MTVAIVVGLAVVALVFWRLWRVSAANLRASEMELEVYREQMVGVCRANRAKIQELEACLFTARLIARSAMETVNRRPPKRRWLALARRMAQELVRFLEAGAVSL